MNTPQDEIQIDLCALADGELGRTASETLLSKVEQNPRLRDELCDIHRLKDMVKYAYASASPPDKIPLSPNRWRLRTLAAGIALLAVGFAGGWHFSPEDELKEFELGSAQNQPNKVVLFIGYADEAKFQQTLDRAEILLKQFAQVGGEVNIVASAGGIDLLRTDTSPFLQRVKKLSDTYQTLQLIACNNTLSRMAAEGRPVALVDNAIVQPSAVQFVVDRLKQGWSYIAI